jgi:tetratricopeptide (TPR) repeat protein
VATNNNNELLTIQERLIVSAYLKRRFSLSELQTLAFINLGIGTDSLPHTHIEEYIRELLQHVMHIEKLPDLLEQANQERPDPLIEQMYQHLKQGVATTTIPTTNSIAQRVCPTPPPPPEYFGGRDVPLAELTEKLKAGQTTAIVAVAGLGGIGKTTLARKVANELYKQQAFRAVLWADIGRDPQPLTILESWASYADHAFQAGDKPLSVLTLQVKNLLQGVITEKCQECQSLPNRTLVVLDDVWDNGLEAVRLLKQACPSDATVLITSRSRNVAVNLRASVQPLGKLNSVEAVALLLEYLPDSDTSKLTELGQALGGHPLALTLAANRILKAEIPNRALAQHLKEYQAKLPTGIEFKQLKLDQAAGREDNLTLVLSYSYEDLAEADRTHFRALGVLTYDQPFDKGILAALWELEGEEQAEELDAACDNLRLLSLLEVDYSMLGLAATDDNDATANDGTTTTKIWYRQHPLLHSYAHALLKVTDGRLELVRLEARYQKYVTEIITQKFLDYTPERWGAELTPYLPHVHTVGNQLVALIEQLLRVNNADVTIISMLRLIQRFAINTIGYLSLRQEVRQLDWLEMGLASSRALADQKEEATFLYEIGGNYADLGDNAKALEYYNQALPLQRMLESRESEAITLSSIGLVHSDLGDNAKALEYYNQALPLQRMLESRESEATTLSNIGLAYFDLGDNAKALEYYNQALPLQRMLGHKRGEAYTLTNMGRLYSDLNDKTTALDYYNQALSLFRTLGTRRGEAYTLTNMGRLYSDLNDKTTALDYYNQALTLSRMVGDRNNVATTLANMGRLYSDLNDKTTALDYYNQALPLFRAVGDRNGEAVTHSRIASTYYESDQLTLAIEYLVHCVELRMQIQHPNLSSDQALLTKWQQELEEKNATNNQ